MTIRITAAELHQRVGDILARIRYTGERVVIERPGKPIAAVVSIEDLERLQSTVGTTQRRRSPAEQRATLARAAAVRQMIAVERKGKRKTDSVETIRELREERMKRVTGHR